MNLHQALTRIEQIGVCKWRDRDHALQMLNFLAGLEAPFVRLIHEWTLHLSLAEAQARVWFYTLRENPADPDNWNAYADFEQSMLLQSREFMRQLDLMKEHSPFIRHSRSARAFITHIIQDAGILAAQLQPNLRSDRPASTGDLPASPSASPDLSNGTDFSDVQPVPATRLVLRRKPGGGWALK